MKFGAGPDCGGDRRHGGAHDPPGRSRAQEGHAASDRRSRPRSRRPELKKSWSRGSSRATSRRTRPRPRSPRRSPARACASTAPSPAAAICLPTRAGVLVVDKDAIDRAQPRRRGDHPRDAAGLQAGGRRRDDRDREDHSVRGCRGSARSRAGGGCASPLVRVAPYKFRKVGVVSTLLPGLAPKVIDKTLKITASGSRRPARASWPSGGCRTSSRRWRKRSKRCSRPAPKWSIVFGASAIADRRDVIPAALEAVGGAIEHFGMPVDPGNLMLIGNARGSPVLGAPGCARSPKENGFDWVLMRLARRAAGHARGHHRHGRRRTADGDRHASAAARGAAPRPDARRRRGARGRTFEPHGRGRTSCSPKSAASRWCESQSSRRWHRRRTGHRRHRS